MEDTKGPPRLPSLQSEHALVPPCPSPLLLTLDEVLLQHRSSSNIAPPSLLPPHWLLPFSPSLCVSTRNLNTKTFPQSYNLRELEYTKHLKIAKYKSLAPFFVPIPLQTLRFIPLSEPPSVSLSPRLGAQESYFTLPSFLTCTLIWAKSSFSF